MQLVVWDLIRRNNTRIALKYLGAQNEIQPLYKIVLDKLIVLLLQLFQEQEIQLMRLFQLNKLVDHFSNDEVFVNEHEEETCEKLLWVNILFKGLIGEDFISYGFQYLCFQFDFFIKVLELLNDLQILSSKVRCILEEHLEAGLLLLRLVNIDKAAAILRWGSVEAKSLLSWIASMILHHFGFIYDTQSIAVFVNILNLSFDQSDNTQNQTVTL